MNKRTSESIKTLVATVIISVLLFIIAQILVNVYYETKEYHIEPIDSVIYIEIPENHFINVEVK